jgi:glycosyltransferase involved in cell wall biosynthesis
VLAAAMVSRIVEDEPALGGAQSFVVSLAHGLVERGHRVTLLAASGSRVGGVETPDLDIDADRLAPASFAGAGRSDLAEQTEAFERVRAWLATHEQEVDVAHAHAYDAPAFAALSGTSFPILHTLHLPPLDPDVVTAVRAAHDTTLVTVSEANARLWRVAGVTVDAAVPNGVDVEAIPFGPAPITPDGYLLFAGRLSPDKGPDHAIAAATALGTPLILAGGAYDRAFYAREIEPRVEVRLGWQPGDDVGADPIYVGPRRRDDLFRIMAAASGLLMPTRFDEPFGLVAAEAMAAGCPVAGYARGGLADLVADGRTGYLVPPDDLAALTSAARRLVEIDRAACRAWIAEQFPLARMLDGYEALYWQASRATGLS